MQAQPTVALDRGICVAHGFGLKVYVDRGHLVVHDGICDERETRRYHRATSKLRRLVVLGHSGYITLEALRWLFDVGAALIHIDNDGKLITTSAVGNPGHAALRRAQALAAISSSGVEVARSLLHSKVAGQASLLPELHPTRDTEGIVRRALEAIATANDVAGLVAAEAEAANAYWEAWSGVEVSIRSRDRRRVPEHWRQFVRRHSLLSNGPRLACNPANAILNYLYALLEAETILACHSVGLDPMLGIFHTDQRNRASLALDTMEPVRPTVDAYVLALLTQRTLAREDFNETAQGSCRLSPRFAAQLAQTVDSWRHHIAPVAEGVASILAEHQPRSVSPAAPLTRAQHRAAWNDRSPRRGGRQPRPVVPVLPNACRDCGTHLPDRRKHYCEHCRGVRWKQHAERGRENAASVLAALRSEQRDPAHGGQAGKTRARKNADHQRAVREWQGEREDPAVFTSEILPALRQRSITELVNATGLSEHYCSLIRLGKKIPHPRHWDRFRSTADGSPLGVEAPTSNRQ